MHLRPHCTAFYCIYSLLFAQVGLKVAHIEAGVSDVVMLGARQVARGLLDHLYVLNARTEHGHPHLTSNSSDLVTQQDVAVGVASSDGDDLAHHRVAVGVCHFDNVTSAQAVGAVLPDESPSLARRVEHLVHGFVQKRNRELASSLLGQRFVHHRR